MGIPRPKQEQQQQQPGKAIAAEQSNSRAKVILLSNPTLTTATNLGRLPRRDHWATLPFGPTCYLACKLQSLVRVLGVIKQNFVLKMKMYSAQTNKRVQGEAVSGHSETPPSCECKWQAGQRIRAKCKFHLPSWLLPFHPIFFVSSGSLLARLQLSNYEHFHNTRDRKAFSKQPWPTRLVGQQLLPFHYVIKCFG